MHYYAIQVRSSGEDDFTLRLLKTHPEFVVRVLKKRLMVRKGGKVAPSVSILFPGYVFLESAEDAIDADAIHAMRTTKGFYRILPETKDAKPLDPKDSEIVRRFSSFGKELGISLVRFDENDRIVVAEGPLKGLEGQIVKIDRRKKRAKIRMDICDSAILFDLGYELIGHVEKASS
jgi:transcriptional antiterminator NusG